MRLSGLTVQGLESDSETRKSAACEYILLLQRRHLSSTGTFAPEKARMALNSPGHDVGKGKIGKIVTLHGWWMKVDMMKVDTKNMP